MTTLDFQLRKRLDFAHGSGQLELALTLPKGQWIALCGPSGAGKTTLLRLLAGLATPDAGRIQLGDACWFDSQRRINLPTRRRGIGFVFQDHALFPHMSAEDNLRFARPRGASEDPTDTLLGLVGLRGLARRYPQQLSGGQQQRLALARALATGSRLLLLDEPLSALDDRLRSEMQALLLEIRAQGRVDYAVLVTHDRAEASRLVDRCLTIEDGTLRPSPAPFEHTLFPLPSILRKEPR